MPSKTPEESAAEALSLTAEIAAMDDALMRDIEAAKRAAPLQPSEQAKGRSAEEIVKTYEAKYKDLYKRADAAAKEAMRGGYTTADAAVNQFMQWATACQHKAAVLAEVKKDWWPDPLGALKNRVELGTEWAEYRAAKTYELGKGAVQKTKDVGHFIADKARNLFGKGADEPQLPPESPGSGRGLGG